MALGRNKTRLQTDTGSLTEGVIWRQLLIFFFPLMFGTIFQQLYSTIDAIILGNFCGTEALAAVGGSTGTIIDLLVGFFVGLSSGATVIISQYYGANQAEKVSKAVHTAIALAIVGAAALTVIGLIGAPYALKAMDVPNDVYPHALVYLRVYFSGIVFSLIYNIGSGILRAIGDSKRPLYFLIVCCMTNLVLDVVLVAGARLEVLGAAIATIFSQGVSAVLVLISLAKSNGACKLHFKQIRIDFAQLRSILHIGLPAGIQSVLYTISNMVIQASVNSFGTTAAAAWTAYGRLDSILWMVINSFGIAITTFVGQNFGANQYHRMRKVVRTGFGMMLGSVLFLSYAIVLFGKYVLLLFTKDPAVLAQGEEIIYAIMPFFFTFVGIEVFSAATRGTGDTIIPMIMTCFGVCVLRIVWIFTALPLNNTLSMLMYCYPITWSVTSILFCIYYLQGGWLKRRIKANGYPEEVRRKRHQKA